MNHDVADPPSRSPAGAAIPFEQAVYGSFAFWDQGYAVLGASPGCRAEWLADFRAVCGRYGERPAAAEECRGLFCLKLDSGPWAVVGVFPQGRDDVGRPGALAFHALFLKGSDYRRAGASPFPFLSSLRDGWTADDKVLPAGSLDVPAMTYERAEAGPEAAAVARAVAAGRRVLVESPRAVDEFAAEVWAVLPPSARARAGLATWAFAATNAFHLIGMPRAPLSPEPPFVRLETLLAEASAAPAGPSRPFARLWRSWRGLGR